MQEITVGPTIKLLEFYSYLLDKILLYVTIRLLTLRK